MSENVPPARKPTLGKGGQAAAEASKQSQFSRGSHIRSLSMDDGETVILRYLTDYNDWIYTAQHNVVPCKSAPLDSDGKPVAHWPKAMTAVCRNDKNLKEFYDYCYICDAKLVDQFNKVISNPVRIWTLAVLRVEVFGDGSEAQGGEAKRGKRIGTTDKLVEVEVTDKDGKPTGETKTEREYVLVNFAYKNFYSGLVPYFSEDDTLCGRDFKITRNGGDKDTTYSHLGLESTANLAPGTEKWQSKYLDDLATREIVLDDIVIEKSSDEFYAKFFDPSKTWDSKAGVRDSGRAAEPEAPSEPNAEEQDRMQALKDRVRGAAPVPVSDID